MLLVITGLWANIHEGEDWVCRTLFVSFLSGCFGRDLLMMLGLGLGNRLEEIRRFHDVFVKVIDRRQHFVN